MSTNSFRVSALEGDKMFSHVEVRHLGLSFIITCVLSFLMAINSGTKDPLRIIGIILIVVMAYFLHEIAHKISAHVKGYWAEFRLDLLGMILTIVSFFCPVKLIAVGQIKIVGRPMLSEDYGKIALAGPFVNISQAVFFYVISAISTNYLIVSLASFGFVLNSTFALVNLFPFGSLDGYRILKWNRRVWIIIIITVVLLFIYFTTQMP